MQVQSTLPHDREQQGFFFLDVAPDTFRQHRHLGHIAGGIQPVFEFMDDDLRDMMLFLGSIQERIVLAHRPSGRVKQLFFECGMNLKL